MPLKERLLFAIPIIMAFSALVLSAGSSFGCYTYQMTGSTPLGNGETAQNYNVEFGLWTYKSTVYRNVIGTPNSGFSINNRLEDGSGDFLDSVMHNEGGRFTVPSSSCTSFTPGYVDATWRVARAASILSLFFGIAVLLAVIFWQKHTKIIGIVTATLLPLLQGLTFLVFKSEPCEAKDDFDECEWNQGCGGNIASIILWFLLGLYIAFVPPVDFHQHKTPATQAVTYKRDTSDLGQERVLETNVEHGGNEMVTNKHDTGNLGHERVLESNVDHGRTHVVTN